MAVRRFEWVVMTPKSDQTTGWPEYERQNLTMLEHCSRLAAGFARQIRLTVGRVRPSNVSFSPSSLPGGIEGPGRPLHTARGMRDEERKRHERDIYDRRVNMERPQYHTYWDQALYQAMHAHEYDDEFERLGERYLSGRKVLILGAGRGDVELGLRFTENVHALNISARVVEELRRLFPDVHSVQGDAERLMVDERYDVVLCRAILHHLHPIENVIERIHGVLRPGGILFVVAEPGLLNPFAAFARRFAPSQQHTPGEKPFVFSKLNRILARHFEPEHVNYHFVLSMLLPYAARKLPMLRRLGAAMLRPTLQLEALLRRVPPARDLYWVITGVYRARE